MAIIHRTTMTPSKLELLDAWLPAQSWYLGGGQEPKLSRVGGFRLDDPRGEVGIEFMAVTDECGEQPVTYHVPLSYRAAPLDGAEDALVGTSEHGVLGQRWIYDGTHDPVLVAQLLALFLGEAEPQAQRVSHTPDPTVTARFAESGHTPAGGPAAVADGPHGTDLRVRTTTDGPRPTRDLTIRVNRVLRPEPDGSSPVSLGHVTAGWQLPDGTAARGLFAVVHEGTPQPEN